MLTALSIAGCAALTDRPPSWGPPVPCNQDPSCYPMPDDNGDNPSDMQKRPDAGAPATKGSNQ